MAQRIEFRRKYGSAVTDTPADSDDDVMSEWSTDDDLMEITDARLEYLKRRARVSRAVASTTEFVQDKNGLWTSVKPRMVCFRPIRHRNVNQPLP
jgi:hypothetical protein